MASPEAVPQPNQPQVGGVCGSLAQYLNTDPTLIRVLFVVLALLGGPGVVIYLALWIVVPEEPLGRGITAGPQFTPSLRQLRNRMTWENAG